MTKLISSHTMMSQSAKPAILFQTQALGCQFYGMGRTGLSTAILRARTCPESK